MTIEGRLRLLEQRLVPPDGCLACAAWPVLVVDAPGQPGPPEPCLVCGRRWAGYRIVVTVVPDRTPPRPGE